MRRCPTRTHTAMPLQQVGQERSRCYKVSWECPPGTNSACKTLAKQSHRALLQHGQAHMGTNTTRQCDRVPMPPPPKTHHPCILVGDCFVFSRLVLLPDEGHPPSGLLRMTVQAVHYNSQTQGTHPLVYRQLNCSRHTRRWPHSVTH